MDPLSPTGQGVGGIGVVSLRLDGLAGISPTGGYGAEGELVLVRAAAAAAATVAQSSAVPFVQRQASQRPWLGTGAAPIRGDAPPAQPRHGW